MLRNLHRSALRGLGLILALPLVAPLVAPVVASAGSLDQSTVTFGFGTGYSAITNQTASTATVGTLLDGPGYLDIFHNIDNSGSNTTYTFTIGVTNLTVAAVTQYHFQLGVSNQNQYLSIDTNGDSIPDYLDPDQDGDGVSNAMDNGPFLSNPSQADFDADGWGDAIDLRPSSSAIPLNIIPSPKTAPFIPASSTIAFANSATALGYTGTLSSDTFSTHTLVGNDLIFNTGSLAPDATATFTLNIVIPDNLENGGFVLRQFASPAPEPGAILSVSVLGIAIVRRKRKTC